MPVLRFYYVDGKKPINATTVSILADGVRYDLAAASTGVHAYGREEAEIISAPLTQASLSLILSPSGFPTHFGGICDCPEPVSLSSSQKEVCWSFSCLSYATL